MKHGPSSIDRCRVSRNGVLTGYAYGSARIEGVNVSSIVTKRLTTSDIECFGTADKTGRFRCNLKVYAGDILRLRWRSKHGRVSDWTTVKVPHTAQPRSPSVALFRIGMNLLKGDRVRLCNLNSTRLISIPHAEIDFRNRRTRHCERVVLNERGGFPKHTYLAGKSGDVFTVSVFDKNVGSIRVPTESPNSVALPRAPAFIGTTTPATVEHVAAPLFIGDPKPSDVIQGELSDCHLAAAVSAIVEKRGHLIKALFSMSRHGEIRVGFFNRKNGRSRRTYITVNRDMYVRPSGQLLFGLARKPSTSAQGPLWWPILEKAYASWKGGYHVLDEGGVPHLALADILGKPPRYHNLTLNREAELWSIVRSIVDSRIPAVVSTESGNVGQLFVGKRVMNNHCYSIISCRQSSNQRWIKLRNPWGEVTPLNCRCWRDGVFELPWLECVRLFSFVSFVGASNRSHARR